VQASTTAFDKGRDDLHHILACLFCTS